MAMGLWDTNVAPAIANNGATELARGAVCTRDFM